MKTKMMGWIAAALLSAPMVASAIDLTDLITAADITTSSDYSGLPSWNGPKKYAIDEDVSTGWNCGNNTGCWLKLDFGANYLVSQVTVYGSQACGQTGFVYCVNSYDLDGSTDGTSWTTIGSGTYTAHGALPALQTGVTNTSNKAGDFGYVNNFTGASEPTLRYLRWRWTGGSLEWAHIMEIDVQGTDPTNGSGNSVPEPATLALLGLGLAGLGVSRRRKAG